MKFHDKLPKLLQRRGLRAADVARMTGIPPARFTDWQDPGTGRFPTVVQLLRLSRVLEVPMEYLADAGLDEPPEPSVTEAELELIGVIREHRISPMRAGAVLIDYARQRAAVKGWEVERADPASVSRERDSDRAPSPPRTAVAGERVREPLRAAVAPEVAQFPKERKPRPVKTQPPAAVIETTGAFERAERERSRPKKAGKKRKEKSES